MLLKLTKREVTIKKIGRQIGFLIAVFLLAASTTARTQVTSVGEQAPADFTVTGSPVTSSGTIALAHVDQNFNALSYGTNGGSGFSPTTATGTPSGTSVPVASIADLAVNRWVTIGGQTPGNQNPGPACGTNFKNAQWPNFTGSFTCTPGPALGNITILANPGTTTYYYSARLVDGVGGFGPAGAVSSIANGPATITYNSQIKVCLTNGSTSGFMFGTGNRTNTGSNAVPMFALYRATASTGPWTLEGISNSGCAIDSGLNPTSGSITDINYPATADATSGNENLRTRITAIDTVRNIITIADTPSSTIVWGATVEKDDGGMLQMAINDTKTQANHGGGATLFIPCPANAALTANCNYDVATVIMIGGTVIGVRLDGSGGGLLSSRLKFGPTLMLGDDMGGSNAYNISVVNLKLDGVTNNGSTNPQKDGLFIGATNGMVIENDGISNFPRYAVIGDKDALSGGVWDHVVLRDLRITGNGYGNILLGFNHRIDHVEFDHDDFENADNAYQTALANDAGVFGDVYVGAGQVTMVGETSIVGNGVTNGGIQDALHLNNLTQGSIAAHFESNTLGSSGHAIVCDNCTGVIFPEVFDNIHQGSEAGSIKFTSTSQNDTIVQLNSESDTSGPTTQMDHAVDFGSQANIALMSLCAQSNTSTACNAGSFNTGAIINTVNSDITENVANRLYTVPGATINGLFTAGSSTVNGSLKINSDSIILKHLSATSSITFGVIASSSCATQVMTVTGANAGDNVYAAPTPIANGIETVTATWSTYVSSTNTIAVKACNAMTANTAPVAAEVWRADVWQH